MSSYSKRVVIELDRSVSALERTKLQRVFKSVVAWRATQKSAYEVLKLYIKATGLSLEEETIRELADYLDAWVDEQVIYFVMNYNQTINGYEEWNKRNKSKNTKK